MENSLSLDLTKTRPYVEEYEIQYLESIIREMDNTLGKKTGPGNKFLGWMDLPINYNKEEFARIKKAAEKIKNTCDVFIVIGIGGSYLGSRAAIEMISNTFYNNLDKNQRRVPQIYFAGNNISSTYMADLLELVKDKDICVNVISKSGTTTEPAIAFRIFKELLEKKYGKEGAKERIFATTDGVKGALRTLADSEGYESFIIPDDVGGRFSVLTPVGLLPIAVSGIDIDEMMKGPADAREEYSSDNIEKNHMYRYVAVRNALYRKGKTTEMLVNFEPCLHYFGEWWKQLYGESEGKDGKGIFPAAADFSTDLHSMGQYIQEGLRNIFETFINVENPRKSIIVKEDKENLDGLNFLAEKDMDYVNHQALRGTVLAHNDGGVPAMILNVPELSAYYFGQLVYFFEKACGISGYLQGVNPFDQPGVEAYKKNMFALLGKPGYEDMKATLEERLK